MAIDVQKNIESVYAPYTDQSILGSDYYTGQIEEDSEFDTPYTMKSRPGILSVYDRLTGPIKNTFQRYGAPIMGGLMSAFTGIPGIGFLMRNMPNDPYAQNRIDMYGTQRGSDGFIKDKFGYNVGNTLFRNNFMEPGSNSYRSYALEGLRGLDQNVANKYYQETYGKSFDDVKKDIQNKKDPFSQQNVFEGTSDYQGDSGSGGQGGVQSSGFADDGGPVSNRTGRGRQGYGRGGRANYKKGGRGRTDAESQYGADSVGSYDSSQNRSGRQQSYGNNSPSVSNDNSVVTTDFIREDPNIILNYADPRNYASIYSKIGFNNILDNDDLIVKGNVTGEFGPIGYNTNFTDQGITGTNLTAGNFNANISPEMQLQNLSYNRGPFSISTDGQNFGGKFTLSYKKGGIASL